MPGHNKAERILSIKRLYFYSLLFFAVLLPFQPKWLPINLGIMFFGLFWLISLNFKQKFTTLAKNVTAGLLFGYFLWGLIGAFYSPLPNEAAKDIFTKIPFLVWPLLLGSVILFTKLDLRKILFYFILSCLASILFCFTDAAIDYYSSGMIREFYFVRLVEYKLLPPHYLGMYVSFSYALVLDAWLRKRYFISRQADFIMLIVFFLAIIFISVRMQYIVFAVVSVWIIFNYTRDSRGSAKALLYSLVVLLIFGSLAWVFPGSRNRVKDTYHEMISFEKEVNDKQTNARKFLWMDGWQVVKDNLWLGTGTGAADAALKENLEDNESAFWDGENVYYLRDRDYNYHNTYLQHWASQGIIGFTLLMAIFIVPLFYKISAEGKIFMLICAMSFLTESMLERQAGILFFSFFYCLFFVMRQKPVDNF